MKRSLPDHMLDSVAFADFDCAGLMSARGGTDVRVPDV